MNYLKKHHSHTPEPLFDKNVKISLLIIGAIAVIASIIEKLSN